MNGDMCIVSKDEIEMLRHYHNCIPILIQGIINSEGHFGTIREWDKARMVWHDTKREERSHATNR